MSEVELRREVLRINRRYLIEVVETYGFCPWAKHVRDTPKLHRDVLFATTESTELMTLVHRKAEAIAMCSSIDVALLIFPHLTMNIQDFRRFAAEVHSAHARHHARGQAPLAMAAFHPTVPADMASAARLVPFLRRSPDPTLQLVRHDRIAAVQGAQNDVSLFAHASEFFSPLLHSPPTLSLADSIANTNLQTVERISPKKLEAILEDIKNDRDLSYKKHKLETKKD